MNVRILFWLALLLAAPAIAQVPADMRLTPFGSATFSSPVAIRSPHDGSGRVFVVERGGSVKALDRNGVGLGTYITVAITDNGEQGLLGMAFDPNYGRDPGQPGYGDFYLAFTAPGSDPKLGALPDQVVRRFTVSNPVSNDASGASAVDVIRIPDLYPNHNGGDIHFAADGFLYYGMGDGGSGGDPNGFAQCRWKKAADGTPANCGTVPNGQAAYYLLGKMMRLDVHHTTPAPTPANLCGAPNRGPAQYAIPDDNPYALAANQCAEIWLYGLRNPFRWSFDRVSGDQWIADVGQNLYEEVDLRTAGSADSRNYGWNLCEGSHYYSASGSGTCAATTLSTAPILEYDHSGGRCAIIGGFRYRGPIGAFDGTYTFSDSCGQHVYFLHQGVAASSCPSGFNVIASGWVCTQFSPLSGPSTLGSPSSFGEDQAGNLYVTSVTGSAPIYKFTSADSIFADSFDW
ncbi:MAG: PQQ-dependent sugar dehydrogenase [Rudaea sp.]